LYYAQREFWMIDFGNVLMYEGKFEKAEAVVEEAERKWKAQLPEDHPAFVDLVGLKGDIKLWTGHADVAAIYYASSRRLAVINFGATSVQVAAGDISATRAAAAQAKIQEGKDFLEEAKKILRNSTSSDRMLRASLERAAGELAIAEGDMITGIHMLASSSNEMEELLPHGHPEWVLTMFELALAYEKNGNIESARRTLRKAEEVARASLGETSPLYEKVSLKMRMLIAS